MTPSRLPPPPPRPISCSYLLQGAYLNIAVVAVVQQAVGEHVASSVAAAYVISGRCAENFFDDTPVAVGDVYVRVRPREVRHRVRQNGKLPHALDCRVQWPKQRPKRRARLVHAAVSREGGRARQNNRGYQ